MGKEKTIKTMNHQAFESCFQLSASIIEDIVFDQARKCLEARSKQLTEKEGKGNKPNAAEDLTHVEENILYEKNYSESQMPMLCETKC